jgi:hypothetical protein
VALGFQMEARQKASHVEDPARPSELRSIPRESLVYAQVLIPLPSPTPGEFLNAKGVLFEGLISECSPTRGGRVSHIVFNGCRKRVVECGTPLSGNRCLEHTLLHRRSDRATTTQRSQQRKPEPADRAHAQGQKSSFPWSLGACVTASGFTGRESLDGLAVSGCHGRRLRRF